MYSVLTECTDLFETMQMGNIGRVKRKGAFKHAQNVRIHIILHMRKVSSGSFALHSYIL